VEYTKPANYSGNWTYDFGDQRGFVYHIGANHDQLISFSKTGPDVNGTYIFTGVSPDGVILFELKIATKNITIAVNGTGRVLTPSQSKFDLTIDLTKIPGGYKLNNSRVAILGHVKSIDAVALGWREDDGPVFRFGASNDSYGYLDWANTVTVNGNALAIAPVFASEPKLDPTDNDKDDIREISNLISFGIDAVQPSNIYWDPGYGIETYDATNAMDLTVDTTGSSSGGNTQSSANSKLLLSHTSLVVSLVLVFVAFIL